jgi:hypothetical protein
MAFDEDALKQFGGRLGMRMLRAPLGGKRSFHRRLQYRGAIELQLLPYTLQRRHTRVEVGEEFVQRISNALLFVAGCDRNHNFSDLAQAKTRTSDTMDDR